ncbi:MAG TPA: plastocyanin/azurin family copper-binding protein [Nitrososphaerales archaeon]|nr:plastocyanin/azurin family copper-binding protein [Nitrososphaerales archaeon]
MLGLVAMAILTLSSLAAYSSSAPKYQQGGSFASTAVEGGYSGGMMGGSAANRGSMMTGQRGMMGGFGNMMSGYAIMFGSAQSAMGRYGEMMNQMFRHMMGPLNQMPNGPESGRFLVISGNAFHPSSITIPKGTTIIWFNMDFVQHTVTSGTEQAPTGLFDSRLLSHMQSFAYTFNTQGNYSYFCDLHPDMIGTVLVTG